jgi:hypothetical protein
MAHLVTGMIVYRYGITHFYHVKTKWNTYKAKNVCAKDHQDGDYVIINLNNSHIITGSTVDKYHERPILVSSEEIDALKSSENDTPVYADTRKSYPRKEAIVEAKPKRKFMLD